MAIGCGRTRDGIGIPIIPGVGRHFITAVGFIIRADVGFGTPIVYGARHGFVGVRPRDIMDGLRCLLGHDFQLVLGGRSGDATLDLNSDSESPRPISPSWRGVISPTAIFQFIDCRLEKSTWSTIIRL